MRLWREFLNTIKNMTTPSLMIKEKYTNQKIAKQLKETAKGKAYHGNALYVAMDIPFIRENQEYKQTVIRYLSGKNLLGGDHCTLQEIANKLNMVEG